MKSKKLLITIFLIIATAFLNIFFASSCKIVEETGTEESKQELETEAGKEISSIEEKEKVPEIILISPAESYEIITNNEDYIILDVRTQEEYNEGHLAKALLIPVDELEGRIDELDQNNPIIVYCRSGGRSNRAANILIKNGFAKVYDMGGIMSWQEEGFPVVIESNTEEILEFEFIAVDDAVMLSSLLSIDRSEILTILL